MCLAFEMWLSLTGIWLLVAVVLLVRLGSHQTIALFTMVAK